MKFPKLSAVRAIAAVVVLSLTVTSVGPGPYISLAQEITNTEVSEVSDKKTERQAKKALKKAEKQKKRLEEIRDDLA